MASFQELIQQNKPVLVDVYADWCGPCKQLAPTIQRLKNQLGTKATILKIDIDKNQALAAKYNIRSVPTLLIFKNGELQWRGAGALPEHQLLAEVEKYINE